MSKTSSLTYEASALRIQGYFGKVVLSQFSDWNAKVRKYEYVQPLRIPSQAKRLSLQLSRKKTPTRKHLITKKADTASLAFPLAPTQCSVNQKYPHTLTERNALSSHRFVSWQFKGHFLVCEALKALANRTHAGLKYHVIVSMKQKPSELPPLTPSHQERLFQIDRVIKYLG